jgi:hypothetical protein
MANSFVRYTGNGTTTTYAIPFSYRDTADLSATVAGVNVTAYTLDAAGTNLTFTTAPANNAAIEIRRTTSQNTKLVDYVSGSVLTENDLDTDSDQAFFMSQEAIDKASDVISLDNVDFNWDIQNKRLKNVADPVDNTDAVNKQFISTNIPNITTVAGISSDVTTVAGISSDVTSVASDATDIGTVATNIASVNTVATNIADVVTVANDLNEAISEIETAANDLNEATSEIDTVSNNITNVNTVGANIANVNTVAGISANVTTVAGDSADIQTLAGITNLSTLASNEANINTVATGIANVNTVASNNTNINTVAVNDTNISTVANISSNVTSVAGVSANVTTVAGISSDVTAVANDATDIGTVATNIANVNNVGGSIASVTTVATNLASVNNFAEQYRISSSAPTTSLNVGDLYFDTTANELKVYKSSGWAAAGSTVNGTSARFNYTATANQTTFTGADTAGNTLAYDAGFADVYLNGVRLSASDVTITSGTSVVLASGAAVGDILDVVAYGTFNVAAVNGSAINSGTINDARLPTTISDKVITATSLTAKGDGSSADGKITLNCSQNSHGVKIQSPAHSAGQSYTLILPTSVGTANQVLATNGNSTNQLSWIDATETKPTVADVSQTIAPATATTISITGTNFVSIPIVEFIKTDGSITLANTVSFTNATTLSVNVTLATGNYHVRVENPDGNAGRSTNNILTASTAPTFSTSAGSLGSIAGNFSGTVATIAGSSDSAVTFSETTSVLTTANCTLSSAGVITTTDFGGASTTPTTYNFTIRITDAEGQTADRNFSFTSSFGATGGGQFN